MRTLSIDRLSQSDIQADRQRPELPIAVIDDLQFSDVPFASDVDGVIWQRCIPKQVSAWLDDLPREELPEGRIVLKSGDVSDCVMELFALQDIELCPALSWLSEDVSRLANWLNERIRAPFLRMRMEVVTDDACSKFHIDNVVARLICTYRGPGTQLATEAAANQDIWSVSTGDPVLLKGKRWPQSGDIPMRHRSPPIMGTGRTRWLLVLEGCDHTEWMPEYDRPYRELNLPERN